MNSEPAPLLIAEMAGMFTMLDPSCKNGAQVWAARDAIASGRVKCYDTETHVAVQKMTEEQARKKFARLANNTNMPLQYREMCEAIYTATLLDMKALKP